MAQENKQTYFPKIVEVIAKQLGKKPEQITRDQRVIEDLGADSLDMIEMLMTLEENYGVVIPDDKAVTLKTVGHITDYLDTFSN